MLTYWGMIDGNPREKDDSEVLIVRVTEGLKKLKYISDEEIILLTRASIDEEFILPLGIQLHDLLAYSAQLVDITGSSFKELQTLFSPLCDENIHVQNSAGVEQMISKCRKVLLGKLKVSGKKPTLNILRARASSPA